MHVYLTFQYLIWNETRKAFSKYWPTKLKRLPCLQNIWTRKNYFDLGIGKKHLVSDELRISENFSTIALYKDVIQMC